MTGGQTWFHRPAIRASALVSLIFAVGVLAGLALDRTLLRAPRRALLLERAAPPSVEALVERARRRLDLDSVQTGQVRDLLTRRQPLLVDAWARARLSLVTQIDTTLDGLRSILTPGQQQRLEQLLRLRGFVPRVNPSREGQSNDVP